MTTPVFLLTGFLGSGKTTLLRSLLTDPAICDTAVVINEFGEVSLDHLLIERGSDQTVVLDRGCVCCALRSGLADTLGRLFRRVGQRRPFKRVIIETSGLADPLPILQTFILERGLCRVAHLQSVITVVDAATCLATLERHREASAQIAIADRLVVTKTDLIGETAGRTVDSKLEALNPTAPRCHANHGRISTGFVVDESATPFDLHRCDGFVSNDNVDHRVTSYFVTCDHPLQQDVILEWLELLLSLTRGDILRVKGILNLIGCDQPVAIHGVQHLVHSPYVLEGWPPNDGRSSRIVLVARDIEPDLINDTLSAVGVECRVRATNVYQAAS